MSNFNIRIGVPQIFLSVDSAVVVPSLSSLTFTASGVTPTAGQLLYNDINQPLLPTDTYQVMLGFVGREPNGGGYTIGQTSASSGNLTVTAGQVIQVSALNANWPANYTYAIAVALFLKTNGGLFQLAGFSYIDPTSDFTTFIPVKPLRVAPTWATVILTGAQSDPILGSRLPLGVTYSEITPTTGTFNFTRPVTNVTVDPNTSAPFQVATTRSVGIEFTSLVNDIKAFVQSAGGNSVQYSTGGSTYTEARLSLNTAQALLRGNRPVQVFMPADSTGNQEVRLLMGLLTVNQNELREAWSKTATTPVTFKFDPAALDRLIVNQHTEVQYLKTTP